MTDAECIPVHVALSLMDTSTLGKAEREPDFLHMYNQIQKTLKAIVNGQYIRQLDSLIITDNLCYRTPSRFQQFHRNVPQDTVQYFKLPRASAWFADFVGRDQVWFAVDQTRAERIGDIFSKVR